MSSGGPASNIYEKRTRNHEYQYLFHPKHHGQGGSRESRWSLGRDDEFNVFDMADDHDLRDDKENLYGIHLGPEGDIRELGTLDQQVAKFPSARQGEPWHGFPLAPLRKVKPPHPEERIIPKEVLGRMVERGLLKNNDRKRLEKGNHA